MDSASYGLCGAYESVRDACVSRWSMKEDRSRGWSLPAMLQDVKVTRTRGLRSVVRAVVSCNKSRLREGVHAVPTR